MNSIDAEAIAEFLKAGGRIRKVEEAVPATPEEVLEYLARAGVKAKFSPGELKAYVCENKRYSLEGLVGFANQHRRSQHLSPFMLPIGSTQVRGK